MPCKCSEENYDKFVAGLFNECYNSTKQIVSFVFGWLSICSWLIAEFPQVRMNFLLRKSDGLSAFFIICWLTGDVLNGVSCFVLDQLFTQKLLGVLWLILDTIMITSHFYFTYTKRKYQSLSTDYRKIEILCYAAIIAIVVNNVLWAGFYYEEGLTYNEDGYSLCP